MLADVFIRFTINTISIAILLAFIYYPRYKHREFVVSASLFNISIFSVLSILSHVDFSLAAGFGLFAILALFTLRSEPIGHTDMGYFFASVSIAVISSITLVDVYFDIFMILIVLSSAYFVDHRKLMPNVHRIILNIDSIPANVMSNSDNLKHLIEAKLSADLISYRILSICYITEVIKVEAEVKQHKNA